MNFKLNFTISPQKEKELFAFLVKECDCSILKGYSDDKDFTVDVCDEPSLYLYAIIPSKFVDVVRVEPCCNQELGSNFSIYPFDESGNNFPLIRYERIGNLYRIYAGTFNMHGQYKAQIKVILKKIERWIKANAKDHKREGSWYCGLTIYDVR